MKKNRKYGKRITGIVLSLILLLTAVYVPKAVPVRADETVKQADETAQYGNVDGTGDITIDDALMILRYSVRIITLDQQQKELADVNCDGKVSVEDSLDVLRYVVKLPVVLGHIFADTPTVDKEATADEPGIQSRHCLREGCQAVTDVQEIPAVVQNVADANENLQTEEAVPTEETEPTPEVTATEEAEPAPEVKATEEATPAPEVKATEEAEPTPEVKATEEAEPTPEVKETEEAAPTPEVKATEEAEPTPEVKPVPEPEKTPGTEAAPQAGDANAETHQHVWGNWNVSIPSTCTEEGQYSRSCQTCGTVETKSKEVDPIRGHNLVSERVLTEPSCGRWGLQDMVCTICRQAFPSVPIPPYDHEMRHQDAKAPTCTENGYEAYDYCANCSYQTDHKTLYATGHQYGPFVSDDNATCTKNGTETTVCDNCGKRVSRQVWGSAKGHSWGAYQYNNDAACDADGTETRTCNVCMEQQTRTKPGTSLGGSHEYQWKVERDPSCTECGVKTGECTKCHKTTTVEIPKTAHQVDKYVYNNDATCTKNGTKTGECTVCGQKVTVEVPGSGRHHYSPSDGGSCPNSGYVGLVSVRCDECGDEMQVMMRTHHYVNGKCKYCNKQQPE